MIKLPKDYMIVSEKRMGMVARISPLICQKQISESCRKRNGVIYDGMIVRRKRKANATRYICYSCCCKLDLKPNLKP